MPAPAVGEPGLCTICCRWVAITDLLPLKGRRTVKNPTKLGEEVGRCKWHPGTPSGIAAYVVRTEP